MVERDECCISLSCKLLGFWQTEKKIIHGNIPYMFDYWADPSTKELHARTGVSFIWNIRDEGLHGGGAVVVLSRIGLVVSTQCLRMESSQSASKRAKSNLLISSVTRLLHFCPMFGHFQRL